MLVMELVCFAIAFLCILDSLNFRGYCHCILEFLAFSSSWTLVFWEDLSRVRVFFPWDDARVENPVAVQWWRVRFSQGWRRWWQFWSSFGRQHVIIRCYFNIFWWNWLEFDSPNWRWTFFTVLLFVQGVENRGDSRFVFFWWVVSSLRFVIILFQRGCSIINNNDHPLDVSWDQREMAYSLSYLFRFN